ncbi:hypothetical protein F0Q45_01200 [Mycobacterium simiae]|uniref:Uncharacterized protein n=1 Tax=Mycobacterium simiae TaxID=1784 RepID=A0A5B1BT10_MYCSI|nr:hypothetical protein [Mycobacterium simiae]KAA1251998.1 hypothetical protein F0Q45_01200 [Mycobacterium simiae]
MVRAGYDLPLQRIRAHLELSDDEVHAHAGSAARFECVLGAIQLTLTPPAVSMAQRNERCSASLTFDGGELSIDHYLRARAYAYHLYGCTALFGEVSATAA